MKKAALLGGYLIALMAVAGPAAMDSELADAAKKRDWPAMRAMLDSRAAVNSRQSDGATALHWAAHWDDLAAADLLIQRGADVNAANEYGATPLMLACTNGSAAMVRRLLDGGADPALPSKAGVPPLLTCASTGKVEAVNELLKRGVDVNQAEPVAGQTALMWAIAERNSRVAGTLIERGANVHARSKGGLTPILFAAQQGDIESARMLLAAGVNVDERSTPPEKPAQAGSPYGPRRGPGSMTPLLMAAASGQEDMALFLLERGADPNAADNNGTALLYAMRRGISYLNRSDSTGGGDDPRSRLPNMTRLAEGLLARGANTNVRLTANPAGMRGGADAVVDPVGATPLILAASAADLKMVQLLLAKGADANLTTDGKTTVLMAAAGLGRSEDRWPEDKQPAVEIVKLLLRMGANVNAANAVHGQTAMHAAARIGEEEVLKLLAAAGANMDAKDRYNQTPLTMAMGVFPKGIPNYHVGPLGGRFRASTSELILQLGAKPLRESGVEIIDILQDTGKSEAIRRLETN